MHILHNYKCHMSIRLSTQRAYQLADALVIALTLVLSRFTRTTQQRKLQPKHGKKEKASFLMLNIAYACVSPVYTRFFFCLRL